MFIIYQTILLFSIFLFVRSYVVIGNYSQLNPKDCGISRVSTLVDTNCFEWHKGFGNDLKRGKLVGHGDAPWVALLHLDDQSGNDQFCTGGVIADYWVITAAHCLDGFTDAKIYLGYNFTRSNLNGVPFYKSEEMHIHPNYGTDPLYYDLGLIKMNLPINTSAGEHSICLPNKFDQVDFPNYGYDYEYAMVAGWGPNKKEDPAQFRLRIAESRLYLLRGNLAEIFKVEGQGICKGDSGAPVWQYYMGRAVIFSVVSSFAPEKDTDCEADRNKNGVTGTWVDSEIDWILNITGLY